MTTDSESALAAFVDSHPAEAPNEDGETFVITSNSGRTVITVRLEPDVFGADAEGNRIVLRTGEGIITAKRDGMTFLSQPLMREHPLT